MEDYTDYFSLGIPILDMFGNKCWEFVDRLFPLFIHIILYCDRKFHIQETVQQTA